MAAKAELSKLPTIELSQLDLQWVQVLSEGWASPLKGFMREEQYLHCLQFKMLLDEGSTNQSIPIVLPVSEHTKCTIQAFLSTLKGLLSPCSYTD